MRKCKKCGENCISIYCSKECNKEYKIKNNWIKSSCLTCGKEITSRKSRIRQFCSCKCSSSNEILKNKRMGNLKKTMIEKYRVENPMRLKDNIKKIKNTNMRKYGVDWYSKTSKFKRDFITTCNKKYGVSYPQQSDKIKKKTKLTMENKYGGFTLKSPELREKTKSTMIERYGADNPLKCKELKRKQQETNIKQYGNITPLTNDLVKQKTAKTLKDLYGVTNISQHPHVKQFIKDKNKEKFLDYIFNGNRLEKKVTPLFNRVNYISTNYNIEYPFQCNTCNIIFNDNLYSGHIPRCPTCFPFSISKLQFQVYDYIKFILPNETILQNKRSILSSGLELDIYIPSKKIAFEIDGLYWHSEIMGGKNKNYHLDKTMECESMGIHLIHIFENEWERKLDIVKRKINHLLHITPSKISIGARKCDIKPINSKCASDFLEKTHLQGKDHSSIRLGAYYNNKLVSVMTFGKLRIALGNKNKSNGEYEMYRFSIGDDTVVGIGGKFLSYFIKTYNPNKIITYADRRYSSKDTIYQKLGFNLLHMTTPNYWYFKPSNTSLYHRFNFRKSELSKKLKTFDSNLSEWENMQLNGYDRIWDCGNYKFEWKENI